MLNLESVIKFIAKGVEEKHPRYKVIDEEHVIDVDTGVELHMYNEWFKLTYDGDVIATIRDFTVEEQQAVWSIKQLIIDPVKAQHEELKYNELQKKRREDLSKYFENPIPTKSKEPSVEENTVIYTG
jgi:transcription-repair coupling factor (superfamily II helicase)